MKRTGYSAGTHFQCKLLIWCIRKKSLFRLPVVSVPFGPIDHAHQRHPLAKLAYFLLAPRTHESHENNVTNTALQAFSNVIGLDALNADYTKSDFRVFGTLKKWYSSFYSRSFCNYCVWDKKTFKPVRVMWPEILCQNGLTAALFLGFKAVLIVVFLLTVKAGIAF